LFLVFSTCGAGMDVWTLNHHGNSILSFLTEIFQIRVLNSVDHRAKSPQKSHLTYKSEAPTSDTVFTVEACTLHKGKEPSHAPTPTTTEQS
jgi:squalene cyclase